MHDHHEHSADCDHAPTPTGHLLKINRYPAGILDLRVPELAPYSSLRGEAVSGGWHGAIAADTLLRIQNDMLATMQGHDGIGLAANQCGIGFRIFVSKVPGDQARTYVNPRIVEASELEDGEEGCLSFPGVRINRRRPQNIVVRAITSSADYETDTYTETRLEGLAAVCAAHEIDHLDGIHYGSGLGPVARGQLYRKVQKALRRA